MQEKADEAYANGVKANIKKGARALPGEDDDDEDHVSTNHNNDGSVARNHVLHTTINNVGAGLDPSREADDDDGVASDNEEEDLLSCQEYLRDVRVKVMFAVIAKAT